MGVHRGVHQACKSGTHGTPDPGPKPNLWRQAIVKGLVWFVEVDMKTDDNAPHYPAIVHFRGASLDSAAADLARHAPDDELAA